MIARLIRDSKSLKVIYKKANILSVSNSFIHKVSQTGLLALFLLPLTLSNTIPNILAITTPNICGLLLIFMKKKTEPNAAIFLDITSYPGDLKYSSHPAVYLIFYGVKGYQDDVDGNVYDQIFSTDGGKLALQTDLDLNGHSLNGFTKYDNFSTNTNNHLTLQSDLHLNGHSIIGLASPPKRQHIITGIFNKSLNRDYVLFNGSLFYISLINLKIKRWHFYIIDKKNISIK